MLPVHNRDVCPWGMPNARRWPPKSCCQRVGPVQKCGHRRGGIMSGLPTSRLFLNPPPSTPHPRGRPPPPPKKRGKVCVPKMARSDLPQLSLQNFVFSHDGHLGLGVGVPIVVGRSHVEAGGGRWAVNRCRLALPDRRS